MNGGVRREGRRGRVEKGGPSMKMLSNILQRQNARLYTAASALKRPMLFKISREPTPMAVYSFSRRTLGEGGVEEEMG